MNADQPGRRPSGLAIGSLELGTVPRVVGTVTEARTLRRLAAGESVPCDVVEVRLDQVGPETDGWQELCRGVGEGVAPVLLTLRHVAEGGAWDGSEEQRQALLREAMPLVQAVDTEIRQGGLAATAHPDRPAGCPVIGSFHDFEKTPPMEDLESVVQDGFAQGADLVKIACFIREDEDEQRLVRLLDRHRERPLSLLGMGPLGMDTRVRLPARGSCLTYGYLDQPVAPGQIHAGELCVRLVAACPAYASARGDL